MDRLSFDDLDKYLLLKNGNFLYKIPFRGGQAVLKVYYGSRGPVETVLKTLDNVIIMGQTSFMPRARLRTEQACMKVWREAGIRVFDIYSDVEVAGLPEGGYALYEYVPGRNFHRLLGDASVPLDERRGLYREFLAQWCRRHRLAVDRKDPRLIHENGDLKHVMDYKGELFWFDFEMTFRSGRHIRDLVSRELMAYIKSLHQFVTDPDLFRMYFSDMLELYGERSYLENIYTVFFRNSNIFTRVGRGLDYRLRPKQRRPKSKYSLAIRLRDELAGRDAPGAGRTAG
ncbi:MAG: hypothetical protein FJ224_06955 [Lentisphaerae bacterium]|nr:hypothetical protein [Lentisphaerota bacterium]